MPLFIKNIPPQVKHVTVNGVELKNEDFFHFPNTIESLKLSEAAYDWGWGSNTARDLSLLPGSIISLTLKSPNDSSFQNGLPPNIRKLKLITVNHFLGRRRRRYGYNRSSLGDHFYNAISVLSCLDTLELVNYNGGSKIYSHLPPNTRLIYVSK